MAEAQAASQVGVGVFDDDGETPGEAASSQSKTARHPCIRCKKNVGRNSVRCRTCQLWIHVECGNISKELFSILANPTKYGGVSWSCDSCQASAARLDERMNALEGRFLEVENRVIRSEGVVQEATRKVDNVEARQTKLEQAMEQEREKMRKERAEEMRERDIRRKNVVMHRVGEAAAAVETAEARREWDLKSCENIFKALNLDMNRENAVRFCRRVGERGDTPRPLIVGLKREWQKEDLLDSAKKLRDTQYSDVAIVPDLTREQRKEEADMTSEVERRNRELSEDDRAKNLEWAVVGARGERRIVKGVARARGAAAPPRGRPAARGTRPPSLLPPRPRTEPWDPATGGRGARAKAPARGGSKRTRADRRDLPADMGEEEEEDEMEDDRQAPPPPAGRS
jgi:hypothetical protein